MTPEKEKVVLKISTNGSAEYKRKEKVNEQIHQHSLISLDH